MSFNRRRVWGIIGWGRDRVINPIDESPPCPLVLSLVPSPVRESIFMFQFKKKKKENMAGSEIELPFPVTKNRQQYPYNICRVGSTLSDVKNISKQNNPHTDKTLIQEKTWQK